RTGFSSVVATLTATMGDAAFLLLAQDPQTALLVFSICFVTGVSFGYLVEWIHGPDYLREKRETKAEFMAHAERPGIINLLRWPLMALMVPGLALGFGAAFHVDTVAWVGALSTDAQTMWMGCAGALLCLLMWAVALNAGPMLVNLAGKMTETSG